MKIFQEPFSCSRSRAIANNKKTISRKQSVSFLDNRNTAIQRTVINENYNAPNSASATVTNLSSAGRHTLWGMHNAHFIPDFVGAPQIPQNMAVMPVALNIQMSSFERRARDAMRALHPPFEIDYSVNVTGFDARFGNYHIPEHLTMDAVDHTTGVPITPQLVI